MKSEITGIKGRRDPENQRIEIANLLRKYSHPLYIRRQALGWGLEELAARSGVNFTAISRFESGSRSPSMVALKGLSKALGISVAQMVYELEAWESVEVTAANAERIVMDAFWAYSYEQKNLAKDWEGGLCEPPEEEADEDAES